MGSDTPESNVPASQESSPLAPRPSPLAPLVVVSGPSGVGKTTVVEQLIKGSALPLRRAVTATTRGARPGEVPERDYHFWSEDEFRKAVEDGRMLEWEPVFGLNFYGTPKSEVEPHRAQGTGVILVIDVKGAARIRDLGLNHLSVFIAPPSFEILEARLRSRGDTAEDRIQRRLKTARDELAEAPKFHHRIVNGDLSEAVRELERVIRERFNQWGGHSCSTS